MTAAELIAVLGTVPPETEVRIRDWEYMSDDPIGQVCMPGESDNGGTHITLMYS